MSNPSVSATDLSSKWWFVGAVSGGYGCGFFVTKDGWVFLSDGLKSFLGESSDNACVVVGNSHCFGCIANDGYFYSIV
jgi:hypothetical protein